MEDPEQLAAEIRKIAESFSKPLVVHHYDADGISSGAIVYAALKSKNPETTRICVKNLNDEIMDQLSKKNEIVFVDLGNTPRVAEIKDAVIIDHHEVVETSKPQFNPHLCGYNGSTDMTAAGAAAYVFRAHHWLGVVGTIGDTFDPSTGLSKKVLERAKDKNEIIEKKDLVFYGRGSRPLIQFLAFNDDPYIPTLSYNEENVASFFSSLNIELKQNGRWRTYNDLSDDEKTRLISKLVRIIPGKKASELVGTVYELSAMEISSPLRDAREFATILNACGRHNNADLGVKICLEPQAHEQQAADILSYHKQKIRQGILNARQWMTDFGSFMLLDGREEIDETIVGIVCGMLLFSVKKPLVGISTAPEGIKASIRVPVWMNIDGGVVMRNAASRCDGVGGGHKNAAGATIPSDKIDDFLIYVQEEITDQRA